MNDFKKNNRFGGGRPSFGGDRGGFRRPGGDFGGRKMEMHDAVCADCGKRCEVPFKPNGRKPVYCKDCFVLHGGDERNERDERPRNDFARDNFPKKEFAKPFTVQASRGAESHDPRIDGIQKRIDAIDSKLDRLMTLLGHTAKPVEKTAEKIAEKTPEKIIEAPREKPVKEKKAKAKKK